MILYLTFNDVPSGIYSSQVIDTIKFLRGKLTIDINLVAFISLRGFKKNKTKILHELPGSIVLPMFPGIKNWRYNSFKLNSICKKTNPSAIIARSVIACKLALDTKSQNIIYDGRGAIDAEWKEYRVVNNKKMLSEISELEKTVINNSNFRISVSNKLIEHWENNFDYNSNKHVVIPCTLNKLFENIELDENKINTSKKLLGLSANDVVFIYSGSVAGWQSFDLIQSFIKPILESSKNNKIVFLSSEDSNINLLQNNFPNQVIQKNLNHQEVYKYLLAGDYGLLIREETITNKVASPVKFAEYLASGLKVIISENLGDYTQFVKDNNCGYNLSEFNSLNNSFDNISITEKLRLNAIATENFTKNQFLEPFTKVINPQNW